MLIKNLAKSIGKIAPQVAESIIPKPFSIIKRFKENQNEAIDSLAETRSNINKITGNISSIRPALRKAQQQIKSGKFGTTAEEKEKAEMKAMFGLDMDDDFGGSFDIPDEGSDFNTETDSSEDSDGNVTNNTTVNKINVANIYKTAKSKSGISTGEALISERLAYQTAASVSITQHAAHISGNIDRNIGLMASFQAEQDQKHYEQAQNYYNNALDFHQKLLEKVEPVFAHYDRSEKDYLKHKDRRDKLNKRKEYSIEDVFDPKRLADNFNSSAIGSFIGDSTMMGGIDAQIKSFITDPMGVIATAAITAGVTSAFGSQIDKINGFFKNLPYKLQNTFSRWSGNKNSGGIFDFLLGSVGDIFGSGDGRNTLKSGYFDDGAVDFDGKTREAIVNVIPMYLSKIVYNTETTNKILANSKIVGNKERASINKLIREPDYNVYDYNSGKFSNTRSTYKGLETRIKDMGVGKFGSNAYSAAQDIIKDLNIPDDAKKYLLEERLPEMYRSGDISLLSGKNFKNIVNKNHLNSLSANGINNISTFKKQLAEYGKDENNQAKIKALVEAGSKYNLERHEELMSLNDQALNDNISGNSLSLYGHLSADDSSKGYLNSRAAARLRLLRRKIPKFKFGNRDRTDSSNIDGIDTSTTDSSLDMGRDGFDTGRTDFNGLDSDSSKFTYILERIKNGIVTTFNNTFGSIIQRINKGFEFIIDKLQSAFDKTFSFFKDKFTKWDIGTSIKEFYNKAKIKISGNDSFDTNNSIFRAIGDRFSIITDKLTNVFNTFTDRLKSNLLGNDFTGNRSESSLLDSLKFRLDQMFGIGLKNKIFGAGSGQFTWFENFGKFFDKTMLNVKSFIIGKEKAAGLGNGLGDLSLFKAISMQFNEVSHSFKKALLGSDDDEFVKDKSFLGSLSQGINRFIFGNDKAQTTTLWGNTKSKVSSMWDSMTSGISNGIKSAFLGKDSSKWGDKTVLQAIGFGINRWMFGDEKAAKNGIFSNLTSTSGRFLNIVLYGTDAANKGGLWTNIKNTFSELTSNFTDKLKDSIWNPVKNYFGNLVKPTLSELWTTLKDEGRYQWGQLKGWFKGSFLENTKGFMNKLFGDDVAQIMHDNIVKPLQNLTSALQDSFSKVLKFVFRAPMTFIKGVTDSLKLKQLKEGRGNFSEDERNRLLDLERKGNIYNFKGLANSINQESIDKRNRSNIKTRPDNIDQTSKDSTDSNREKTKVTSVVNSISNITQNVNSNIDNEKSYNTNKATMQNNSDYSIDGKGTSYNLPNRITNNTTNSNDNNSERLSNDQLWRNESTYKPGLNTSFNQNNSTIGNRVTSGIESAKDSNNIGNIDTGSITGTIDGKDLKNTSKKVTEIAASLKNNDNYLSKILEHTASIDYKLPDMDSNGSKKEGIVKRFKAGIISPLWNLIKAPFNLLGSVVEGLVDSAKKLLELPKYILKSVTSVFTSISKGILNVIPTITNGIIKVTTTAVETGTKIFTTAATLAGKALGSMAEIGSKAVTSLFNFANAIAGPVMSGVSGLVTGLAKTVGPTLDAFGKAAGQLTSGIINLASNIMKVGMDIVGWAGNKVGNAVFGRRVFGSNRSSKIEVSNFSDLLGLTKASPLYVHVVDGKIQTYSTGKRRKASFFDNKENITDGNNIDSEDKLGARKKDDKDSNGIVSSLLGTLGGTAAGALLGKASGKIGGVFGKVGGMFKPKPVVPKLTPVTPTSSIPRAPLTTPKPIVPKLTPSTPVAAPKVLPTTPKLTPVTPANAIPKAPLAAPKPVVPVPPVKPVGFWGKAGSIAKGGALGIAGGILGGMAIDKVTDQGSLANRGLHGALDGALLGATVGSVIPVLGTAVGAGVGAVSGAIYNTFGMVVDKIEEKFGSQIISATETFTNFPTRITKWADELPYRISEWAESLPQKIISLFDADPVELAEEMANPDAVNNPPKPSILASLFKALGKASWALISNAPKIGISLVTGLVKVLGGLWDAAGGFIKKGLYKFAFGITDWFQDTWQGIKNYIAKEYPKISKAIGISGETVEERNERITERQLAQRAELDKIDKDVLATTRERNNSIDKDLAGDVALIGPVTGIQRAQYETAKYGMNQSASSLVNSNSFGKYTDNSATKLGSAEVNKIIDETADKYGIPRDIMHKIAVLESNKNPYVVNKLGYKGLYQFGPTAAQRFGITGRELDPKANAEAAAQYMATNAKEIKQYGIPVNATTLYLAHQQGAYGLNRLWKAGVTGQVLSAKDVESMHKNMATNIPAKVANKVNGAGDFLRLWDNMISAPTKEQGIRNYLAGISPGTGNAVNVQSLMSGNKPFNSSMLLTGNNTNNTSSMNNPTDPNTIQVTPASPDDTSKKLQDIMSRHMSGNNESSVKAQADTSAGTINKVEEVNRQAASSNVNQSNIQAAKVGQSVAQSVSPVVEQQQQQINTVSKERDTVMDELKKQTEVLIKIATNTEEINIFNGTNNTTNNEQPAKNRSVLFAHQQRNNPMNGFSAFPNRNTLEIAKAGMTNYS